MKLSYRLLYILTLIAVVVFSYGFIDPNFPYQGFSVLRSVVYEQRGVATIIYSGIVVLMFVIYALILRRADRIKSSTVWKLIFLTTGILLISYPAFSNDIFNYIATAKVTYFYGENPYLVMPIEIENEPMLAFMHAANKYALYGVSWIALTAIPYFLGFSNLLLLIFTFKVFIAIFYLGLSLLIWKLSGKKTFALILFALNPLVVLETFVGAHNDVVMMFFALFAYYLLQKKRLWVSLLMFAISVLIKYATIFLLPVYAYVFIQQIRKKKINWDGVWIWSAALMFVVFLLSPLREELYSWYFIWPLTFIALLNVLNAGRLTRIIGFVSLAFSLGLLFRFAPFIFTRDWGGMVPLVKKIVSLTPPLVAVIYIYLRYAVKKA